jgi:hypothetical protein
VQNYLANILGTRLWRQRKLVGERRSWFVHAAFAG